MERSARHLERGVLDPPDGSAVGGSAGSISSLPDLPPTVSAVGPGGHHRQVVESDCTGPTRPRWSRPERIVHRWLLLRGQKRGPCVGKTKKGKGTKIMAIADRAGLPLALWIESASPHEVTLVEKTLDQMLIDEQPECLIGDKAYDSDGLGQASDGAARPRAHRTSQIQSEGARPKTVESFAATADAGRSSVSSRGSSTSGASLLATSSTPTISKDSCTLRPRSSCSGIYEMRSTAPFDVCCDGACNKGQACCSNDFSDAECVDLDARACFTNQL